MKNTCEALEARHLLAAYIQDTSFGDHGTLAIPNPNAPAHPFESTSPPKTFLDNEGRVLVVTNPQQGGTSLTIRRYHADGTIDKNFNGKGVLTLPVADSQTPPLVTLLRDNSIVVAMRQTDAPLLEHYTVHGKLDSDFAINANTIYKVFSPSNLQGAQENLSIDSQGRIVWEQYFTSPVFSGVASHDIALRMNRFLPSGTPDTTFGRRGGLEVMQPVEVPQSYTVQGKTLNLRDDIRLENLSSLTDMTFTAPQIDSDNNVIVAGSRDYARGQSSGGNPYSQLPLPFIYSFDRTAAVNRKLIVGLDASKAKFVNNSLQYTGLEMGETYGALSSDNSFYLASQFTYGEIGDGLAVFKPSGSTFTVSGFDDHFNSDQSIQGLQVFGNTVWALRENENSDHISRLTALSDHATAGETVGLAKTVIDPQVTFLGVKDDLPERIVGFTDFEETALRSVNLTDQEGSAAVVDGVLKITGTAGEDDIAITQRSSDGRYVVSGAGPTHTFAPKSFSKIQIDALGGDDLIEGGFLQHLSKDFIVFGDAGDDTIYGADGNDLLDGGSGDDSINSRSGVDTLKGESGNDTLSFDNSGGAGDQIFGGSGTDESFKSFGKTGPTYNSVEDN